MSVRLSDDLVARMGWPKYERYVRSRGKRHRHIWVWSLWEERWVCDVPTCDAASPAEKET